MAEPSGQALFDRIYPQLRAMAQRQMNAERAGHTLSATALVHEVYLKLAKSRATADGSAGIDWRAEAAFCSAAAEAMRRILVDHARARASARRGGQDGIAARRAALSLSELPDPTSDEQCDGFLILDEAIARLEGADPQAAAVVRLRYFCGLELAETAAALGVSDPTVKRAWSFARAWLKETIEREMDSRG